MKRIATALALGALGSTAAMAASGDAWYGTSRDGTAIAPPTVTYVERVPAPADRVTVYYDEPLQAAPVIVERDTYVRRMPSDVVILEPVHDNDFFVVEPRTYSRVGRDLFPDRGPNDFGQ